MGRGEDVVLGGMLHAPDDQGAVQATGGHELAVQRKSDTVHSGGVETLFLKERIEIKVKIIMRDRLRQMKVTLL